MLRDFAIKGNDTVGKHIVNPSEYSLYSVFDDVLFQESYLKWLKKFSNEKYVRDLLSRLKPEIDSLSGLIKLEDEFYSYDYRFLIENANKIRKALPEYEQKVRSKSIEYELVKATENECVTNIPFKQKLVSTCHPTHLPFEAGIPHALHFHFFEISSNSPVPGGWHAEATDFCGPCTATNNVIRKAPPL